MKNDQFFSSETLSRAFETLDRAFETLSRVKKILSVKSDQFFSGYQYISPTSNFTLLKVTLTKNFYQLFFLLNKNQITEILKFFFRFAIP